VTKASKFEICFEALYFEATPPAWQFAC
jgi:hypothetical protein